MRLFLPSLTLLLSLALPTAAHADTTGHVDAVNDFTFTTSTGDIFTFTLGPDSNIYHSEAQVGEALFNHVVVHGPSPLPGSFLARECPPESNVNLQPGRDSYATDLSFDCGIQTKQQPHINLLGHFSQSLASITQDPETLLNTVHFYPGTYTLTLFGDLPPNTLTITAETDLVLTPEPSTFALLSTGIVTLTALARRKLAVVKL